MASTAMGAEMGKGATKAALRQGPLEFALICGERQEAVSKELKEQVRRIHNKELVDPLPRELAHNLQLLIGSCFASHVSSHSPDALT